MSGVCKQHIAHLNDGILQRCLIQATVHSVTGKQFDCFMINDIRKKTLETEISNNILYMEGKVIMRVLKFSTSLLT